MIIIYGASDDLIEVEGEAKGCDEYGGGSTPKRVVLLPSGDVFRVQYGDPAKPSRAVWTVEHEVNTGHLVVAIERAPEGDDPDPYTDKATVTGVVERVEVWREWPPASKEIRSTVRSLIEHAYDDDDLRCWSDEKVLRVWEALKS